MPQDSDFETLFQALTGHPPFRWQTRLHRDHFATGVPPDAVDLPTGLGKTSVMAIWLIALARQFAERKVTLPRRLVYVVDRRTVVDQATAEAEMLRIALSEKEALADMARCLGVSSSKPLAISTLRGQHADNRKWLEDPSAPAIIIGTVDMIGSRLLFEGYGVSRGMRPNAAGLMGADTLLVLDEAHLCPPFEALLRQIETDESLHPKGALRDVVPKFRLLTLSATGRENDDQREEKTFRLEQDDFDDPIVAQRLSAAKHLRVQDLPGNRVLETVLADRAVELAGSNNRVLVYSNIRDTAEKIAALLRKTKLGDVLMLVGARRVYERKVLAKDLVAAGFLTAKNADPVRLDRPVFLVATSAGEVGIDIDADHMVCDLVEAERMIQRLGRVNRRGREDHVALVDVFVAPWPKEKPDDTRKRLAPLRPPLGHLPPVGEEGRVLASPEFLRNLRQYPVAAKLLKQATTEEPLRPALTRAVLDAWSLTSLDEHPGRPRVDPWLRGWDNEGEPPRATVLWRRWLPWRTDDAGEVRDWYPDKGDVKDFFDAARPHLSEQLETTSRALFETLVERAKRAKHLSDGAPAALVLTPDRKLQRAIRVGDLRQKDKRIIGPIVRDLEYSVTVVSAFLGGIGTEGLLNGSADGYSEADPDAWPGCLDKGWEKRPDILPDVGFRIEPPATEDDLAKRVKEKPQDFRFQWTTAEEAEHAKWLVVIKEDNQTGDQAVQHHVQTLDSHTVAVLRRMDQLLESFNLGEYSRALRIAARIHDAGKERPCWQLAMRAPKDPGAPYAKTLGPINRKLMTFAGKTYRHEFGSLHHVETDDAFGDLDESLQDLVLHLIAAHHGNARPNITAIDPEPKVPPSKSRRRAYEAMLRFERLQRVWGPWGLAWLEGLLRAADRMASGDLEKGKDEETKEAA